MDAKLQKELSIWANMLFDMHGGNGEVLVFETTGSTGRLALVEDGHFTKMTPGDPMPADLQRLLAERTYEKNDYLAYYTTIIDNRLVMDTYIRFVLNEEGECVALLCFLNNISASYDVALSILRLSNFNAKMRVPADSVKALNAVNERSLIHLSTPSKTPVGGEDGVPPIRRRFLEIVDTIVGEYLPKDEVDLSILTQEKKIEIVRKLNQQGVFDYKGMVSEVAKRIFCSEATIYRYLTIINRSAH